MHNIAYLFSTDGTVGQPQIRLWTFGISSFGRMNLNGQDYV